MIPRRKRRLFCSFCRRPDAEVQKLVGGPGVHICDACIDQCLLAIAGKQTRGFGGWDTLSSEVLLEALAPSEASVDAAREVLQAQIDILRKREISWAQIGEALGISRQAAWERFS